MDSPRWAFTHLGVAVAWFALLVFARSRLDEFLFPLARGGTASLGSVSQLLIGCYFAFVAVLFFRESFARWRQRATWRWWLAGSAALPVLFGFFHVALLFSAGRKGVAGLFPHFFTEDTFVLLFFFGLCVAFPVSIYLFVLAVRSLRLARREGLSLSYGLLLLVLALAFFFSSLLPTLVVGSFWIFGVTKFL